MNSCISRFLALLNLPVFISSTTLLFLSWCFCQVNINTITWRNNWSCHIEFVEGVLSSPNDEFFHFTFKFRVFCEAVRAPILFSWNSGCVLRIFEIGVSGLLWWKDWSDNSWNQIDFDQCFPDSWAFCFLKLAHHLVSLLNTPYFIVVCNLECLTMVFNWFTNISVCNHSL